MQSMECRLKTLIPFEAMEKMVREGVEKFEEENAEWVDKRLLDESVERILKHQMCEFGRLARIYNAPQQ